MTETSAASNGGMTSTTGKREHGRIVLRDQEARGLISLASYALTETGAMVHDLHEAIYDNGSAPDGDCRDYGQMLDEALQCLGTTEHYLLMLGSVFEEQVKIHARP
jgi:hypothetical protein